MRYFLLLIPCLVAELVAIPAAFIVPIIEGIKPGLCKWFVTPDNPIYGDEGHQERTKDWPIYLSQVWWLLRNRAYGFKLYAIGCEFSETVEALGNPNIKNRDNGVAGHCLWLSAAGWYWKSITPIGHSYCLQLAFGWQLDAPINGRCLYMFSPRVTKFLGGNSGRP